jgi:hypothetical protein
MDVPSVLIPGTADTNNGPVADFASMAISPVGALTDLASSPLFIAMPLLIAVLYMTLKLMRGDGLGSIIPVCVLVPCVMGAQFLARSFAEPPDDTLPPVQIVSQIIHDDKATALLNYLRDNSGYSMKDAGLFDYVRAQVSIKEREPDIELIQKVVDDYRVHPEAVKVPADVRYSLEMSGFRKTLTSPARAFAESAEHKARAVSSVSSGLAFLGGLMFLAGSALVMFGGRMKKRLVFIRSFAVK